jgi:hypothetical protein
MRRAFQPERRGHAGGLSHVTHSGALTQGIKLMIIEFLFLFKNGLGWLGVKASTIQLER